MYNYIFSIYMQIFLKYIHAYLCVLMYKIIIHTHTHILCKHKILF